MRIGIVIGRIGDIDGVSLETEKWIHVLREMGHEIFIIAGRYTAHLVDRANETYFPTLSFFSPECEWEQKRAFHYPEDDAVELVSNLTYVSDAVATRLFKWIMQNRIEMLLVENAGALPCHLSMGMGIKKVLETTCMPAVAHDHDFWWERGARYDTPHAEIREIVETTFPICLPNVKHAVINHAAKREVRERYNEGSVVVPNVMDFDQSYAQRDQYNQEMLKDLGLAESDIPLFQVTRIAERKRIDTAIDLIERVKDKKIKLVVTGSKADDHRFGYFHSLIELVGKKDLDDRVFFVYQRILPERGNSQYHGKIYSISDSYAMARACTYFSSYEGFGNAFLECCLAKKPIFVNNYEPVYWEEIGSKGFDTVMIEDNILTDEAVAEIEDVVHDEARCREIGEFNFELGRKHFSFDTLREMLPELFDHGTS